MKDILGKLSAIEEAAPKKSKKILTETATSAPKKVDPTSLKSVFEAMVAGQPIPVVGKQGDTQQTGAGFLNITDPALQGLGKALGDLAAQKKIQMVVPTQPGQQPNNQQQNQQTIKPQSGVTGQPQAGQSQMQEEDADESKNNRMYDYYMRMRDRYTARAEASSDKSFKNKMYQKASEAEEKAGNHEGQLDEISSKTLKSYSKKADIDQVVTNRELKNRYHTGLDPDLMKKTHNRTKGMKLAGDKMMGRSKVPANEDEQLDEISNSLKSNYAHKAANQMADSRVTNKWDDNKFMKRSKSLGKVQNQLGIGRSGGHDPNDKIEYMREGAKVDRMVKHIAKSEREAGKSKDKAEDIAWATANKRGMLDNKNKKKKVKESLEKVGSYMGNKGFGKLTLHSVNRDPKHHVLVNEKGEVVKSFHDTPENIHKQLSADGLSGSLLNKKVKEADIPSTHGIDTMGAGLGAGRSRTTFEGKKMKKKLRESVSPTELAWHKGHLHGLEGSSYCGKNYDDIEERKAYHEGYKEGLDEANDMDSSEAAMPATMPGMANDALPDMAVHSFDSDMNDYSSHDDQFSVSGKTFSDRVGYDIPQDEMDLAFESWDKHLNDLINEGLSVSVSKGNENAPDSVNINATDADADQILALVKNAGLGLFGNDDNSEAPTSSAMSVQPVHGEPDEVGSVGTELDVVDGSDDMLSLMKKLGGVEASDANDYAEEEPESPDAEVFIKQKYMDDEEEATSESNCNECGMMEAECHCNDEPVEEKTEDQREFEVAEENAPDSGAEETEEEDDADAESNESAAEYDAAEEDEEEEEEEDVAESFFDFLKNFNSITESSKNEDDESEDEEDEEEEEEDETEGLNEWANQTGKGPGKGTDASFEQDIEFMTKMIAGGLNKPKSTGQTTVPVIAGQNDRTHTPESSTSDSVDDWKKLAGLI